MVPQFSGFSSRNEEEIYNKSVFKTLYFLQLRMVNLLRGTDQQEIDPVSYERVMRNLILKLQSLEQSKSVQPMFSHALKDVTKLLGLTLTKRDNTVDTGPIMESSTPVQLTEARMV